MDVKATLVFCNIKDILTTSKKNSLNYFDVQFTVFCNHSYDFVNALEKILQF